MQLFSGAHHAQHKVVKNLFLCCCLLLIFFAVPRLAFASSQAQFEGELEILHWDNRDKTSTTKHFLRTADGKRYELHFQGHAPHYPSGTKLRVKGSLSGSMLALSSDGTSTQVVAAAPSTSLGVQKTAVILVNFQDNTAQPVTSTAVQNLVFTTVNNFYMENSFQQTSFSGTVLGWYTIPVSSTTCATGSIQTYAQNAAVAAGVDLSQFTRFVYMFPKNACTWAGMSQVGGSPTQTWINGSFTLMTVGHELGHALGLFHAHALDCGATTLGSSCTSLDYGDTANIMGNNPAHLNAVQKEQLGWLNAAGLPPITTVQSNGTYTLDPYETNTGNPKALKILKSTDPTTGAKAWYYIEFRQPVGFDSVLSSVGNLNGTSNLLGGVLIHTATDGDINSNELLDMTPNSNVTVDVWDFWDAAQVPGQTFTDQTAGVTIFTSWVNSTNAGVAVTFSKAACNRSNPSVVVSSSQSTSVAAGTPVTYTVAVTNNDSTGCGSSTFNLQNSVPAGWTGTLASSSLSISAGSASSTTLTATSQSTATAGSYSVGATATNAASSTNSGSGSAIYSVATTTTTTRTKGKKR
jgi:hypothetical protein